MRQNVSDAEDERIPCCDDEGLDTEIIKDEDIRKQAVWLIDGYSQQMLPAACLQPRQANTIPYPMLPYMGLLHTALGAELSDFMQGKKRRTGTC